MNDDEAYERREGRIHKVAEEIDIYLREQHAPPIWWHISDIAHKAAGCVWDNQGGEDGFGCYDCESGGRTEPAAEDWQAAARNNWDMLQDETP